MELEPTSPHGRVDEASAEGPAAQRDAWERPEIVSFRPVSAARGILYSPGDGLANLT